MIGERPKLEIRLHRKQGQLFQSRATEILFGGSAGGGKSHGIRACLVIWCLEIPGLQCFLFRRNYNELIRTHSPKFRELLAPLLASGYCQIAGRDIRFGNGAAIYLQNADRERDVDKFRSFEFHVLALDELTTFTEAQYRFLRSRVRMAGVTLPEKYAGLFPRIIAGSNPGGTGHKFVKEAFVVGRPPMELEKMPPSEGGFTRQFIPSRLKDNPSLKEEEYTATLSGLKDPTLIRAMLDGDWSIVAGSIFGDLWRHDLHVMDAFPIPEDWQVWRGGDDGYESPAAIYWLTQDPSDKTYYVAAELVKAKMLPEEFAGGCLRIDGQIDRINWRGQVYPNRDKLSGLLDSAAFADTGLGSTRRQGAVSRGKQINALGCEMKPVEKWPGSRRHRAQNLARLLAINPKTGKPGIRIFRSCVELIDSLPTLPRDPRDKESVDTDAYDHPYDGLTYGLQWREIRAKVVNVQGV